MTGFIIVLALLALVLIFVIKIYNGLVARREHVNEAWSDITVQLKRRYDLIPNLVETVKGYASHEKDTLENVVKARNAAVSNNGSPEEQAGTENILTGALRQVFALSESYPDLKANENYAKLQHELSAIEEVIQKARRYYNGSVRNMNTAVDVFPNNLIAKQFGFEKATFFELDEAENAVVQDAPKVDFKDEA